MYANRLDRLVLAVATVKIVGVVSFHSLFPLDRPNIAVIITAASFLCSAVLLLVGGRLDERAASLGTTYLLLCTLFTDGYITAAKAFLPVMWEDVLDVARFLPTTAFIPTYLWRFFQAFPDARPLLSNSTLRARIPLAIVSSALLLVLANVVIALRPETWSYLKQLSNLRGYGFLAIVILPSAWVIALAIRKGRSAEAEPRKRSRVFLRAFGLGTSLYLFNILLQIFSPSFKAAVNHPRYWLPIFLVTQLPLAIWPLVTVHAVLSHGMLDVRLIARRALQYLLARYTLLGLAFGPLLVVFAFLAPLLPLHFAAWQLAVLGGLTLLGFVGLLNRERLERALERAFSRERYDSQQTLTLLIDPLRSAGSFPDLARILVRGVDRALHPKSLALFLEDGQTGRLTDPLGTFPPLDASSQLAGWVAGAPRPFDTELGAARSAVDDLSQEETSWVESGRFQLLVPLFSSQGALLGLLALGERQSGTAYSEEDRELLSALAVAAGPALELLRRKQDGASTGEAPALDPAAGQRLVPALECHSCELLFPTPGSLCTRCGAALTEAPLPYMIPNRYRFEQRLGAGGMGIVYRGTDLALGRTVAAKTLRQATPDEAARLRREARTAAQVLHPNLALIWDIQTWRDAPVIILEHMGGGTLTQRLRTKGPLDPWEAVDLGLALAGALEQLHRLKILHRDIKPSNIGFTQDGTPKLLDFGIARVTLDLRPEALSALERPTPNEALPTVIPTAHRLTRPSQRVEGTLAYVSPETLAGNRPDATADLWSLCLVLYECLTGEPVFSGETEVDLLLSIRIGVPSLRELMPGTPRELVAFFDRNLHKNRDYRAPTAASLRAELDKVAKKLAS